MRISQLRLNYDSATIRYDTRVVRTTVRQNTDMLIFHHAAAHGSAIAELYA
jgi:hypothetical protein